MVDRSRFARVIPALFLFPLVGCGGGREPDTTAQQEPAVSPEEMGSLAYQAKHEGPAPDREEIDASANPECGQDTIMGEDVVVNDNETRRDVVIAVQDGPGGYAVDARETLIDQENCKYKPHTVSVKAGETVKVTDSDPDMHNVRATRDGRQLFNLTTFQGDEKEVSFEEPGVVKLECNIHPWMEAWVYVTEHGNAAVTGEDGEATLEQLPEGDYEFEAWHEELGSNAHSKSIKANEQATIEDVF